MRTAHMCLLTVFVLSGAANSSAAEWFVAAGGSGTGTSGAPFGTIQEGLNIALPGDVVTVMPGTYSGAIQTVRNGASGSPIIIRAQGARGSVIVTASGRVVRVDHAYVTFEGLVLDGQYGAADTVDVNGGAHYLVLRNLEIRRSSRDLVDIANPRGVLIESCLIHHALNAAGGRTDAHGIVAGAVQDLTVRDTEIHTFSGDGLQVDPGRAAAGWQRVTIEGSRIWLAPLTAAENGFAAGTVPGENAVDTKVNATSPRATMIIRDTIASGFQKGLISNMAAFNLKENVDVSVDRVTVRDSEIAFRLRGPGSSTAGAHVTIKNAVVHSTTTAFRYEDNIEELRIWNATVGAAVTRSFQAASSSALGVEVRNVLFLGPRPAEATHPSNLSVGADAFVNAAAHNYELASGSPAIDAGIVLADVTTDRNGVTRPQGNTYDVGAYERVVASAREVVVHAWRAIRTGGNWSVVADPYSAGGANMTSPNIRQVFQAPVASPANYFDVLARVEVGVPYRLWIRSYAARSSTANDSAWVQFSSAVDASGAPMFRIGTTSAAVMNLEECSGCGVSGWGWQDNGWGIGVLGPTISFAVSGLETIRVQTREDGLSIDQIVLSPLAYLNTSPGAAKNDSTILEEKD